MAAWHKCKPNEMGPEIRELVNGYKRDQGPRRGRYTRNLSLYEKLDMAGYSAHGYETSGEEGEDNSDDRLNLVRSSVSSAVASIYAPQKPKPQFQTLGATWATRRKAYKLDRICEGIINQRQGRWLNVWAFMADAGIEAALQGVAAILVIADKANKRIQHKLIPLPDIFVDPDQGRDPTEFFVRMPVSQDDMVERYPKFKVEIEAADEYDWNQENSRAPGRSKKSKTVEMLLAYKLPISTEKPGRFAVVIGSTVIEEGEWTAPAPPLVFLIWEPERAGFWGRGIADEAWGLAEDSTDLDSRLLQRERVAAHKFVFYEKESVNPQDLTLNDEKVGVGVEKGAPFPQESLVPAFSPMELDYAKYRIQLFWDAIGISQMSAAARREPGIESGIAMMTLNDTKAGRQLPKAQRFEQAFVDLAHQYVWRMRELAAENENFAVQWPGKTMIRSIKWSDADVEDDMFSITVAPASALPHDPAGRQEMIQRMLSAGLISQESAKELIGWPDLQSELDVENAEGEYIDVLIDKYLDAEQDNWGAGDYQPPEGFIQNKVAALHKFSSAWFRARIEQQALPPDEARRVEFNLAILQRYIQEMVALMSRTQMKAAPPPGPAPVPPPALDQLAPAQAPMPGAA